jgi:hypothetical protein
MSDRQEIWWYPARHGAYVMVSDRHGLPLCVKYRFIRRSPYAVQVLYILLSVQSGTESVGVN